jgi:cytochrome c5
VLGIAALGAVACAHLQVPDEAARQAPNRAPGQAERQAQGQAAAGIELPPGQGRALLERECLNCHELKALTLFSAYYNRERWRALVMTMRGNGAVLDDAEVEVVADYLARNFGTGLD